MPLSAGHCWVYEIVIGLDLWGYFCAAQLKFSAASMLPLPL